MTKNLIRNYYCPSCRFGYCVVRDKYCWCRQHKSVLYLHCICFFHSIKGPVPTNCNSKGIRKMWCKSEKPSEFVEKILWNWIIHCFNQSFEGQLNSAKLSNPNLGSSSQTYSRKINRSFRTLMKRKFLPKFLLGIWDIHII